MATHHHRDINTARRNALRLIGQKLRVQYDTIVPQELPPELRDRLSKLDANQRDRGTNGSAPPLSH
jgi:hypothetical protein